MPFTASHPAAVLPLLGSPLPASALVMGSMAPDVPYYFPDDPGWPTHTSLGVVSVDLLIGLAVWLLWHGLLAAPAQALAPRSVRGRTAQGVTLGLAVRLRSPAGLLLVVLGLVVGATTHVLWDGFTHAGRFGPQHLSWLREEHASLAGYRWAQYASGIVGALAIALWVWRWWMRTAPAPVAITPQPWRLVRCGLIAAAVLAGVTAAATSDSMRAAAFAGATRGGGTAVALALAVTVMWQLRDRQGSVTD